MTTARLTATQRRARSAGGFTLLEVLLSTMLAAIVLAGLTSAVVIVSRGAPNDRSQAAATLRATEAYDAFSRDMQYATAVTERTDTAVTVTVPDRNADGNPETIRYSWDGKAGSPLKRSFNGAAAVDWLAGVQALDFDYPTRTVTTTRTVQDVVTSAETLFASLAAWTSATYTNQTWTLAPTSIAVEVFTLDPAQFPSNTTSIAITRVRVHLMPSAAGATATVSVNTVSGYPSGPYIFQAVGTPATWTASASAASMSWVAFSFTDATTLLPTDVGAIKVSGSASPAVTMRYYYSTSPPTDTTGAIFTSNGGSSWTPTATNDFPKYDAPFEVYGTYTTRTLRSINESHTYLVAVNLTLRLGDDAASVVRAGVRLENQPEVAGP